MAGGGRARWVWVVAAVVGVTILIGGFVVYQRRDRGNGHVVSVEVKAAGNYRDVCATGTANGQEIKRCGWVHRGDQRFDMKVGDCAVVGLVEEHWFARC
jgi:hypothetical protein